MTIARMNRIPTNDFTNGQAFIGRIEVRAPVNPLQTAITKSIAAAA
jgi:hypothetical protein